MTTLFQNLKVKIRGDNISLPQAKHIAPIVYSILLVVGGIGIATTLISFFKPPISMNNDKGTTAKIAPSPKKKFVPDDFDQILQRNLFNLDGTLPDSGDEIENVCSAKPKKSTLAFKITGILFGGTSKTSLVVLEKASDRKTLVLKLGDKIIDGTTISDITNDKIYISGKGCPEYLEINYPNLPPTRGASLQKKSGSGADYSENGFERVGNTTSVTKQWVNDILNNKLSSALEDARAVPYLEGGQIKGFTVTQIVPDSVYSKLGLKNGDVVSNINGIELNDAARAIQTLNSLRSESKIELEVIRDGQPVNLKVNVQ